MNEKSPIKPKAKSRLRHSIPFRFYFLLILITTAVTWATGLLDVQHQSLPQDNFGDVYPGNVHNWELFGNEELLTNDDGNFEISPDTENHTRAEITLTIPELNLFKYGHLRVRSVVNTIERASGRDLKTDAGLLARLQNESGDVISTTWVSRLTGEFNVHKDEALIELVPEAKSIHLIFSDRKSDGAFELETVNLDIVKQTDIYKLALFPALILLWALTLGVSAQFLLNRLGVVRFFLLAGTMLVLIGGVLLSPNLRQIIIEPIFQQLKTFGLAGNNVSLVHYYKIGHFLTFCLVTFTLLYNEARIRLSRIDVVAVMLILAIATEGAQLHLFFRTTKFTDVLIDLAGVIVALIIYHLYRARIKKLRKLKRKIKKESATYS